MVCNEVSTEMLITHTLSMSNVGSLSDSFLVPYVCSDYIHGNAILFLLNLKIKNNLKMEAYIVYVIFLTLFSK